MRTTITLLSTLALALGTAGCREYVDYNSGRLDFEPERPQVDDPPEVELVEVPTLTMRHLQDAAPPAKGDLSSLVDDLMEPRAPVVRHETVTEPDFFES